ncbi:DUF726-domain-containing protein [Astrocystis sublimbata]|nr:DUF726-domain-containing protein [Astrocystis sublimbata]
MASIFQKAGDALRGKSGNTDSQDEGASLTTVLGTDEDRGALTLLICDITEIMRKRQLDTFDSSETGDQTVADDSGLLTAEKDTGEEAGEAADANRQVQPNTLEKQKAELAKREKEVNEASMVELKTDLLNFFDDWRDTVILRVGEAINSRKEAGEQSKNPKPELSEEDTESSSAGLKTDENTTKIDEVLRELYPPVDTSLRALGQSKRVLILHSMLLLMLSLEHYNSYSRTLLLHCTASLGLSVKLLSEDEGQVAKGLLIAAKQMSAEEETKKKAEENSMARKWKMGAAGVAGATLIGITGGLAAPFLAAGIGTVLGGIGLGATATAGLLGSLAGSGVLVGGLFGAYGARMSTQAMERYTRDVEDFAFIPVEKSSKDEATAHRLRVGIGISGWLSDANDVVLPWKVLDGEGLETFALRYEVEALQSLGNSLRTLITSLAWKFAKTEIIKRTVFAALMAGLWPISLTNAGRIIDNPWSIASQRAQKAGEVLADALINKAQGERPVTLIGYSLGARVIYICLQQLAKRKAFGLVENVVLLGAPTPSDSAGWRRIRSVVAGRLVNAYSSRDYILAFLYRTNSIQYGVAGLQPVLNVKGVENVNVGDLVEGHTLYRHATGPILGRLGFEDVNFHELKHEEHLLKQQEQEERQKREEAGSIYQPDGDEKAMLDASNNEISRLEDEAEQSEQQNPIASRTGAQGSSERMVSN